MPNWLEDKIHYAKGLELSYFGALYIESQSPLDDVSDCGADTGKRWVRLNCLYAVLVNAAGRIVRKSIFINEKIGIIRRDPNIIAPIESRCGSQLEGKVVHRFT